MGEVGTSTSQDTPVEDALRRRLARADVVLDTIGPILAHLLVNHDQSLFSDEIVSRVRGMMADLARQLLGRSDTGAVSDQRASELADRLSQSLELLGHCHALALEWQLTTRLEARHAIDPVLSPLLQTLIASDDPATASNAMALLAAQARFVQRQRRMELPLAELPPELFHEALVTWREHDRQGAAGAETEERLRRDYQESASRLGLLSRLVEGMPGGAREALSISDAGVPLFVSALALAARQPRELAVLSTNERQSARLALVLRAAGIEPDQIERQFLYLHPDASLPEGFDALRPDRAAALLSGGRLSAV